MVVVGDGLGAHPGVGAGCGEILHGGHHAVHDVKVFQRSVFQVIRCVVGGEGVPFCDDVEAGDQVGVLDTVAEGAPLHREELHEDGRSEEGGLLLDELHLLVPEVEMFEERLAIRARDVLQAVLDG